MGIFSGIDKAEVYGGGQRIRRGRHRLRIRELLVHQSRKRRGTAYFVAEFEVVESMGGRPMTAQPTEGDVPLSQPHMPGDKVSWIVDMTQASALSNVKGFALALAPGAREEDVTEESMEYLVSDAQPARGVEVIADATVILTDSTKRDFVRIRWTPATASASAE